MLKPPLLGLVMVVKNEASGIRRTLDSVASLVDLVHVHDTGSTDGTETVVRRWCWEHFLPCIVTYSEFRDFSSARNLALRLMPARWALMLSGDEVVSYGSPHLRDYLKASVHAEHDATVRYGDLQFGHPRLIRPGAGAQYVGATHEVLLCRNLGPRAPLSIRGGRAGEDRTERLLADLELLRDDPSPRGRFYLAQTHQGLGELDVARELYKERAADHTGDEDERWEATLRVGLLGQPGWLYLAGNQRPERAEPWFYLAQHYRRRGNLKEARVHLDHAERCRGPAPETRGFVHLNAYRDIPAERAVLGHGILGACSVATEGQLSGSTPKGSTT